MLRWIRRMHIGIALSILTPLACYLFVRSQGPVYGRFDWPVVTITIFILEMLLLSLIVEGMRPRNPYRYADPLLHYLDVDRRLNPWRTDLSMLWHTVPILFTLLVLLGIELASG